MMVLSGIGTDPKLAASNTTRINKQLNANKRMGAGKARTPPLNSFKPGLWVAIFIIHQTIQFPYNKPVMMRKKNMNRRKKREEIARERIELNLRDK
jgi:hypothetical protein